MAKTWKRQKSKDYGTVTENIKLNKFIEISEEECLFVFLLIKKESDKSSGIWLSKDTDTQQTDTPIKSKNLKMGIFGIIFSVKHKEKTLHKQKIIFSNV